MNTDVGVTVVPARGRVYVRREQNESITKGGIVLPGSNIAAKTGVIMAVGQNRVMENGQEVPFEFRVGDRVGFNRYGATDAAEVGLGDNVLLLKQEDVLCKFEESE